MDDNTVLENQNEDIMEIQESNISVQNNYIEAAIDYQDIKLIIENTENIEIFGTSQQRQQMFQDWALYFNEVSNPENTTVNKIFGGAKYSPLNEVLNTIRPILGKYGLSIIQTPYMHNGEVALKTIVTHKNGAIISFPQLTTKLFKPNNAVTEIQAFGSASSYLRRFSINAIAGVMGEIDNDGNDISNKKKEEPQPPKEPTKEEIELKNSQAEIVKLATEKIEKGIDKDVVYGIISSNNNEKKNPNAIKDLSIAKKIIKEIKALKVEEKKENENE